MWDEAGMLLCLQAFFFFILFLFILSVYLLFLLSVRDFKISSCVFLPLWT